jgi:hypothetical protein
VTVIRVVAETPSARAEPLARTVAVGSATAVWRPERGWLCSEHLAQPCPHTVDLAPGPSYLCEQ